MAPHSRPNPPNPGIDLVNRPWPKLSSLLFSCLPLFLFLTGCAASPKWVGGTDRSDFYYQGVGSGSSASHADRNALFELCAAIHGIEVEQVVEDFTREHGTDQTSTFESDFKQWISTYTAGKVPAETRIAERWQGKGQHWAYALVEKPGQQRRIQRLYNQAMARVGQHAFVPGWAQFQKKQPRRAWTYIGGVGIGILGGASFALLSNDALERRDQVKTRIERDHYDELANRRFWISSAFYALAGGTYVINVLDGRNSRVQPYQILTRVEPQGVHLAVRF